MGRKLKLKSGIAPAKAHKAGASVFIVQPLVHARLGAIAYDLPHYWTFHYAIAKRKAAELAAHHQTVLQLEPGAGGIRDVTDEAFLIEVYDAGSSMVSNAVRAVQHLAEQIERTQKTNLKEQTCEARIIEAAALFSEATYVDGVDYAGLAEINKIRDALEHPRAQNIYTTDLTGWDGVPLAWMISDRSLDAWNRFDRWLSRVSGDWEKYQAANATPATISVERGVGSLLQVKKPLRSDK